jgi:hypothetical protein
MEGRRKNLGNEKKSRIYDLPISVHLNCCIGLWYLHAYQIETCPIWIQSCHFSLKLFIFCLVWLNVTFDQVLKKGTSINWTSQKRIFT